MFTEILSKYNKNMKCFGMGFAKRKFMIVNEHFIIYSLTYMPGTDYCHQHVILFYFCKDITSIFLYEPLHL